MEITIGSHQVILKGEVLKKDIIPLSKLSDFKNENTESIEELLQNDPVKAMSATDILVEVFVVSIDNKTSREEVKAIVDEMTIPEFNDLIMKVTENMRDFEKKSPISSTSTKSSSWSENDDSPKNG